MKYLVLTLVLLLALLFSCKKGDPDPSWDVDMLAPILKTTLTLDDLINDSLRIINSDNSVSLIYSNPLYSLEIDSLFTIPDTSSQYTAKLSNLSLGTINISHRTSLGDIANKDLEENGPTGGVYEIIMTAYDSHEPATISPIEQQVYDNVEVDGSAYFQEISISEGYIDFKLKNGMPIEIKNLIFEIRNVVNNELVLQDTVLSIPANDSVTKTKALGNMTVYGEMKGIIKFESPGCTSEVYIDTSYSMTAKISIRDVKLTSAIAKFPNQNLIDEKQETTIKNNDVQITKAIVKQGTVNITVFNTLTEALNFNYTLFSAKKNNSFLNIIQTVPPASGGVAGQINLTKNLAGYELNFKGIGGIETLLGQDLNNNGYFDADTVNTLFHQITGGIDSTGQMIHLSLNDSIYLQCTFSEIIPEYVSGYLGQDTLNFASDAIISVIPQLQNANLNFNNIKVSVNVSNQFGINGAMYINSLKAVNSIRNISSILTTSVGINPFFITKPINTYSTLSDIIPTENNLQLNNSNSNINQLFSLIPDKIEYNFSVITNQTQKKQQKNTEDFIYYGDKLTTKIDIEVPLSFAAENVILIDTAVISMNNKDIINFINGSLYLYADNYFPLEATVVIKLLNESNVLIEEIVPSGILAAGDVNLLTGKVSIPNRSKISIPVNKTRLENLINSKKVIITAQFKTIPTNQFVKIYNNYTLGLKITTDFKYRVSRN